MTPLFHFGPSHFECGVCGRTYAAGNYQEICGCGGLLLARYDLDRVHRTWTRESLQTAPPTMWRYAPLLPVSKVPAVVSLGEGLTPLIRANRLGERFSVRELWIKDEGRNPAGSFEARAMSCAVSMCLEFGVKEVALASAGNTASVLGAYAAAAGITAHLFVPRNACLANVIEGRAVGAEIKWTDGVNEETVASVAAQKAWRDLSTLKQPYSLEGQKTLGFEIAEQFGWRLPEAIVFPCVSGMGLIAMGKAFDELEALGWIDQQRPKLIAVQNEGGQPAMGAGEAVRKSGGAAVRVNQSEALDAAAELASCEGIFAGPEGGACVAAIRKLLETGVLRSDERAVLVNTDSGLKYLDLYARRYPSVIASEQDKLGGLITPR